MIELSIVIPCYNESANLKALVDNCSALLHAHEMVEIILVDNGSSDDSAVILKNLLDRSEVQGLKIFHVPVNKGYGYGILQGLSQARGKILCWTHADLQTDIFDTIKAWQLWKKDANENTLIKGKRKGRGLFDTFFTSGMQWYVWYKSCRIFPENLRWDLCHL